MDAHFFCVGVGRVISNSASSLSESKAKSKTGKSGPVVCSTLPVFLEITCLVTYFAVLLVLEPVVEEDSDAG